MMKLVKKGFHAGLLLLLGLTLLSSCKDEYQARYQDQQKAEDQLIQEYLVANNITTAQRQASGLYYIPGTPGNGTKIQKTNTVQVHYIGRLLNYGSAKFESTYENGQTKQVKFGLNQVVKGLEEGLLLMEAGEKATLIMPSGLGYGQYGNGYTIPANSTLLYEITVMEVK
jgi:FKBP-type peptidyl-prolyl cis-trans isomerase